MALPPFSNYEFIEQISDHSPFQAWYGTNKTTAERCFIKCISADGEPNEGGAIGIALQSLQLQKRMATNRIVRARRHVHQSPFLLVEYPLLDESKWQQLEPRLFLANIPVLLPEICLVLDYLHLLGLVHADIKLGHFLVSADDRPDPLRLVDLDFLSLTDSKPQARILGSPEHIAPEILANDRIVCQSDAYSLGIELQRSLALTRTAPVLSAVDVGQLAKFANCLCEHNYVQRPASLLDACLRFQLVSCELHAQKTRQLLGMLLVTRSRHFIRQSKISHSHLARILKESCGIYGLHHDFVQCLSDGIAASPRTTVMALRSFIEECELSHFDQYWLIGGSEDQLRDFYHRTDPVETRFGVAPEDRGASLLAVARDQISSKLFQRAYLTLLEVNDQIGQASVTQSPDVLALVLPELARTARVLNRHREAYAYFRDAIQNSSADESVEAGLIHDAAMAAMRAGLLPEAEGMLERGRAILAQSPSIELELRLDRILGWLHLLKGDTDRAQTTFLIALRRAEAAGLTELGATLHYMMGVLLWRRGRMLEALTRLSVAHEIARSNDLTLLVVSTSSMLAALHGEQAMYLQAIRFSKRAVATGSCSPEHAAALPAVFLALVTAFIRLSAFSKASHWLQRYLSVSAADLEGNAFLPYLVYRGFLCSEKGALREAEEALFRAAAIVSPASSAVVVGKLYQTLAQIAFWRAKVEECRDALAKARNYFRLQDDQGSLAETGLIEELNSQAATGQYNAPKLSELAAQLFERQSMYYAALAVLHLMLLDPSSAPVELVEKVRQLTRIRGNRRVPVFAALAELDGWFWGDQERRGKPEVAVWKRAFVHLLQGKQLYLAARFGLKVADLYAARGQSRHAHSFRSQVFHLGGALSNEEIIRAASVDEEGRGQADQQVNRLSEAILGISELIKNVGQYDKTLRTLLQFAIDHTGAERGILFLHFPGANKLRIGASINCDDQSLVDVTEFSSQATLLSVSDAASLLIEDALNDRRTNKFQSIVRHNILSVACVPLYEAGALQGVLYLDHHAIPALFEKRDLQFITSISNFLSVVLATTKEFRGLELSNRRLQNKLHRDGRDQTLVTVDPSMLSLLARIPEIASSTASVVLLGETGTGKEILCELLHAHSRRSKEPLVKLNCAALSQGLLESELFGIAKSVATGVAERDGKLAAADGGTLYVDEVGDMPLEVQAKILRAVEYQQFEKVGSTRTTHTDIRFIYATNKDLRLLMEQGKFRSDLFHRISTIVLEIPPLRARRSDIPILLDHFTAAFARPEKPPCFSAQVLSALTAYDWPGNVRELRNFVERTCILNAGQTLGLDDLPLNMITNAGSVLDPRAISAAERANVAKALIAAHGNKTKAARLYGSTPSTFRRKLIQYDISYPK